MRDSSNSPISLRLAYLVDAAASGAMGVLLLAAAAPLAAPLGLPVVLSRGAGVILVPFAALLVWLAGRDARSGVPRLLGRMVVAGNAGWTLASVLLVATSATLTGLGQAFVLAQAAAVLTFTVLEAAALRAAPLRRPATAPAR